MANHDLWPTPQGASQLMTRIAEVNPDFAASMREQGMEIDYDDDIDFLRITLGEPREGLALPLPARLGSVLIYDPDSLEIIALEAPFFQEKLAKSGLTQTFWHVIADLIADHGPTVFIPGAQDSERAGKALQDLIRAG